MLPTVVNRQTRGLKIDHIPRRSLAFHDKPDARNQTESKSRATRQSETASVPDRADASNGEHFANSPGRSEHDLARTHAFAPALTLESQRWAIARGDLKQSAQHGCSVWQGAGWCVASVVVVVSP
jgi:hypothetical protein